MILAPSQRGSPPPRSTFGPSEACPEWLSNNSNFCAALQTHALFRQARTTRMLSQQSVAPTRDMPSDAVVL